MWAIRGTRKSSRTNFFNRRGHPSFGQHSLFITKFIIISITSTNRPPLYINILFIIPSGPAAFPLKPFITSTISSQITSSHISNSSPHTSSISASASSLFLPSYYECFAITSNTLSSPPSSFPHYLSFFSSFSPSSFLSSQSKTVCI